MNKKLDQWTFCPDCKGYTPPGHCSTCKSTGVIKRKIQLDDLPKFIRPQYKKLQGIK